MITDTAFLRNRANYHEPTDTIETLDFDKMTEVINSAYHAIVKLINNDNMDTEWKKRTN